MGIKSRAKSYAKGRIKSRGRAAAGAVKKKKAPARPVQRERGGMSRDAAAIKERQRQEAGAGIRRRKLKDL